MITEGKTDVVHLKVAWSKLNAGVPLPFDIVSCGGVASPKEDRGGADMLRTMLRACCLHLQRNALGLFDHDREGMEQFNSLIKADGFVDGDDHTHCCHQRQPVRALLLPVPPDRQNFVSRQARSCYLALEHYYSDTLLEQFDLKNVPVVADSAVFDIVSHAKKKLKFAEALNNLDAREFVNFKTLFNRIIDLIGIQEQVCSSPTVSKLWVSSTFATDGQIVQMQHDDPPITMAASIQQAEASHPSPKAEAAEATTNDDSPEK